MTTHHYQRTLQDWRSAGRRRLIANARRARTIADREQLCGRTDMSVRQTRRMALSVAASQRAMGACRRESIHLLHAVWGVLCTNCPPEVTR